MQTNYEIMNSILRVESDKSIAKIDLTEVSEISLRYNVLTVHFFHSMNFEKDIYLLSDDEAFLLKKEIDKELISLHQEVLRDINKTVYVCKDSYENDKICYYTYIVIKEECTQVVKIPNDCTILDYTISYNRPNIFIDYSYISSSVVNDNGDEIIKDIKSYCQIIDCDDCDGEIDDETSELFVSDIRSLFKMIDK